MKKFISFVTAAVMSVSLISGVMPSLDVSAADEDYVVDFEDEEIGVVGETEPGNGQPKPIVFAQKNTAGADSVVEIVNDGEGNKALKITKKWTASNGSNAGAVVKFPNAIGSGMYEYSFDLKIESFGGTMPYTTYSFGGLSNWYKNEEWVTKGLWQPWTKGKLSFGGDSTDILASVNDKKYHTFKIVTNLDAGVESSAYYIDGICCGICSNSSTKKSFQFGNFLLTQDGNSTPNIDGVYYIDNIKLKNVSNSIKSVTPANGSDGVAINSKISVKYAYPYMESSEIEVSEDNTVLTADTDYTLTWNTDKTGFDIAFPSNMRKSKTYTVKVGDAVVTQFYTGGFAVDNYIVDFDFDEMTTGDLTVGWPGSVDEPTLRFVRGTDNTTNNAGSKAEIAEETGSDGSTNKYLKITKDDTAMKSGALIKLPEELTSGVYEFSYDVRFDNHSRSLNGGGFGTTTSYWWNGSVSGEKTCTSGFDSYLTNVIQLAAKSISWASQNWYNVRTVIDLDNHAVTYYLNDKFWASKSTGTTDESYNGILYLNFLLGHDATYNSGNAEGDGIYSVDNIVLKEIASDVTGYITAITDGEGTAATSVYGLKGKTARVNTSWISNVAQSGVRGLMAVYDDGMLVAVQVVDEPITLAIGKNTVNFELEIPETVSSAATAKIFMFGSIESMKPICKTINW